MKPIALVHHKEKLVYQDSNPNDSTWTKYLIWAIARFSIVSTTLGRVLGLSSQIKCIPLGRAGQLFRNWLELRCPQKPAHDDVIKWKHFPRYWPFVRGIHRSPVNSPQRPVTRSFDVFFDLHPNKRLSKHWWGWWFDTPSCPLWRHRNETLDEHQ